MRIRLFAALAVAGSSAAFAQGGARPGQAPTMTVQQALNEQIHPPNPLKHAAAPTGANITASDLMTRLYIYADDSMMGRETGTEGHIKATNYIAAEAKRLGLQPAGDNGTYFQGLPVELRSADSSSTMMAGGHALVFGRDFLVTPPRSTAVPGNRVKAFPTGARVIYNGGGPDIAPLTIAQVRGRIVLNRAGGQGFGRGAGGGNGGGRGGPPAMNPLDSALGVINVVDAITPAQVKAALHPREGNVAVKGGATEPEVASTVSMTRQAAEELMGMSLDSITRGQVGGVVATNIKVHEDPRTARNVVAILPGSDPKLKGEYVAIGAHNDHVGIAATPVDHDSVRLYNAVLRTQGLEGQSQRPSDAQAAELKKALDSLHKLHGVRIDSINNGADDDGSGTVTVLEIAEKFAKTNPHPKRSIIFVWHVGEEKGLWGSDWFTRYPTVPRDSIVAQLNMDMVGRGKAEDIPGGGADYIEPVGWKRLSSDLGAWALATNASEKTPFKFDSTYDAPFQSNNIYCRSDHANYARFGIPISYFTTGLHRDYHQVTDEPEYIDYPHMAAVGQFMYDLGVRTANQPNRPKVDGNVPKDPLAACRNNGVVPDSLAKPKIGGR